MGKVVGVGGVFLKAKDPKGLMAWYVEHLGLPAAYGSYTSFEGPETVGTTAFSFFAEKPANPDGEGQQPIVNFRVDSLSEVLEKLQAAGVRIDPKRDEASYGKFGWFWDLEGNRVELWEPAAE